MAAKLTPLFLLILLFSGQQCFSQDNSYQKLIQKSKAYTLQIIEAMPEDGFDSKPVEGMRTFREQAFHLAYTTDYFTKLFTGEYADWSKWNPGDESVKSRSELLEWTANAFDKLELSLAGKDLSVVNEVTSFIDHNAHHRGQLIVYLRLKGITPPEY